MDSSVLRCELCGSTWKSFTALYGHKSSCGGSRGHNSRDETGEFLQRKRRKRLQVARRFGGPSLRAEDNFLLDACTLPNVREVASCKEVASYEDGGPCRGNDDAPARRQEVTEAAKIQLLNSLGSVGARVVDQLIRTLCHPSFDISHFQSSVRSASQLRRDEKEASEFYMSSLNFKEVRVSDPEDTTAYGVGWFRDPVEVLQRQLRLCSVDETVYHNFVEVNRSGRRVWNHPMSADAAHAAVPQVESCIRMSADGAWSDGISFVGAG